MLPLDGDVTTLLTGCSDRGAKLPTINHTRHADILIGYVSLCTRKRSRMAQMLELVLK